MLHYISQRKYVFLKLINRRIYILSFNSASFDFNISTCIKYISNCQNIQSIAITSDYTYIAVSYKNNEVVIYNNINNKYGGTLH